MLAFRSVRRCRLRTGFMVLGVAIGIATLTALDAVGERTRRETLLRFKNMLGTFDTVIVRPGAGKTRGMVSLVNVPPTLRFEDAQAIAGLASVRQVALVQNAFDIDVKYRDKTDSPAVFGVSSNWLALRGDELDQGEFFSPGDEAALARVAILGRDAARALFAEQNPLGQRVRIGDVPFEIKGVLRSRGAGPAGSSLDDLILIPVTTASRRLFNRDYLTMAIAQLKEPEDTEGALKDITTLLRDRHHIAATALDDFTASSPRAVMARVTLLGSTLSRTLRGVGLLAILIGGVVIMTLMLSAVSERRREIGVCRSVGASQGDILRQFLCEALLAAGLGGVLGIVLGIGGSAIAARAQGLPPLFSWVAVAWTAGVSFSVGVVFGTYPAWRAAQVRPADALRA
jgi:putative ABC transport system permease protein